MEIEKKISILADAAKYDVSCSSSGSSRENKGKTGNTVKSGICHSWSEDGRCISLLKILMSNNCIYDCRYCVSRFSNDVERADFSPEEIADLTIDFYKRNYIEGLFLSSAVNKSPNYSMEQMFRAVFLLRKKYGFYGYIHVKIIPDADSEIIRKIGYYADRVSINLEFPDSAGLKKLAPQKNYQKLLLPMEMVSTKISDNRLELVESRNNNHYKYVPAGQTTQMMVGALREDTDYKYLKTAEMLYKTFNMKRVYFSAYIPADKEDRQLVKYTAGNGLFRENRLYQADWLMRFYRFSADEILGPETPDFDINFDPKINWALNNIHRFPIEVNKADYFLLLRIPGVGMISAQRIIKQRKYSRVTYQDLKKMGVVLKRAKYFITCTGKYFGEVDLRADVIRTRLLSDEKSAQLSFF